MDIEPRRVPLEETIMLSRGLPSLPFPFFRLKDEHKDSMLLLGVRQSARLQFLTSTQSRERYAKELVSTARALSLDGLFLHFDSSAFSSFNFEPFAEVPSLLLDFGVDLAERVVVLSETAARARPCTTPSSEILRQGAPDRQLLRLFLSSLG